MSVAPDGGDEAVDPDPLPRRGVRLTLVFVAVVVAGLVFGSLVNGDGTGESDGPAPDFTVRIIGQGSFSLADHLREDGRPVVLNLWASWCIPCREEIPDISAFALANPGVKVIGVAVQDSVEDSIAFAEEIQAAYDLALGDDAFERAYPVIGLPTTFVISSDGTLAETVNGIVDEEALTGLVAGL